MGPDSNTIPNENKREETRKKTTLLWNELTDPREWKLGAKTYAERLNLEDGGNDDDTNSNLKDKYRAAKKSIVAAATPLTGVSAIDRKHAMAVLKDKLWRLLNCSFEKVVLKTVYLDYLPQEDDTPDAEKLHWPELQIQSQHRARCLRSISHPRTLWNTGKTALETVTPQMLYELLCEIQKDDSGFTREDRKNIIVSLGSKYPQASVKELNEDIDALGLGIEYKAPEGDMFKPKDEDEDDKQNCRFLNYRKKGKPDIDEMFITDVRRVWEFLFEAVFGSVDDQEKFIPATLSPWVEINVRHYLRECIEYNIGGNEYLSPDKMDDENASKFVEKHQALEVEFRRWLEIIDDVARKFQRKLLLKLPFRGDLLFFIKNILDVRKKQGKKNKGAKNKFGIQGITLINAFKAVVSEAPETIGQFSSAWYGRTDAWGDAADKKWKYQMSGELLAGPRNEILAALFKEFPKEMEDMELHIGGGIMTDNEITLLRKIGGRDNCVQIGTWGLLNYDIEDLINRKTASKETDTHDLDLDINKSRDCSPSLLKLSGKSIDAFPDSTRAPNTEKGITHRFAFLLNSKCKKCLYCNCSKTYYCDSFLTRNGEKQPPFMDPRNCTGCGLCIQCCPNGAIHLFKPEHFICLIGENTDVTWKAHNQLMDAQLPHFVYTRKQLSDIIGKYLRASQADSEIKAEIARLQKADGEQYELTWHLWKNACRIEKEQTRNLSVENCPVMLVTSTSNENACLLHSSVSTEQPIESICSFNELMGACNSYWKDKTEKSLVTLPECLQDIIREVNHRLGADETQK